MVDVFSPCVTYNKINTYPWFKSRVQKLGESGHDPTDFGAALDESMVWTDERVPIGVFLDAPRPTYESQDPGLVAGNLIERDLRLPPGLGPELLAELA